MADAQAPGRCRARVSVRSRSVQSGVSVRAASLCRGTDERQAPACTAAKLQKHALCLPLYSPCWAKTARCGTGWEEHSVSNRGEAAEPLLEKALPEAGQETAADRRGTITLLLHYSSHDLPLLLLAFSAGAHAAQLPCSRCYNQALVDRRTQLPRMQVPWLRSGRR